MEDDRNITATITPDEVEAIIALAEYVERQERRRKRRRLARRAGLAALTIVPGGWAFTYDKDWS